MTTFTVAVSGMGVAALTLAAPAEAAACASSICSVQVGGKKNTNFKGWDNQDDPTGPTIHYDWYDEGSGLFSKDGNPPSNLRDVPYGGKNMLSGSVSRPYPNDRNPDCGTKDKPKKATWTAPDGKDYKNEYIGWTYKRGGDIVNGGYRLAWGNYDCRAPEPYQEESITCVVKATDTLWGPVGTEDFPEADWLKKAETVRSQPYDDGKAPTEMNPRPGVHKSAWNKNAETRKSITKCEQGMDHSAKIKPKDNPLVKGDYHLGQWELTTQLTIKDCVARDYKNPNTEDQIVSCTAAFDPVADEVDGFKTYERVPFSFICKDPFIVDGWVAENLSFENCDTPIYSCLADADFSEQPGYLDGRTGSSFKFLNNGKPHVASWRWPVPTGDITDMKPGKAWLTAKSGSTPMLSGMSVNDTKQPYRFSPRLGHEIDGWKAESSDSKTEWDLRFMAAGSPGAPFTVTPYWSFTAKTFIEFPAAAIGDFDEDADKTVRVALEGVSHTCEGKPAEFGVYKPRISSGR